MQAHEELAQEQVCYENVSYYFLREDKSKGKNQVYGAKQGQQASTGSRREDLLNLHSTQWREKGPRHVVCLQLSYSALGQYFQYALSHFV